jgi:hypothetical protein
VAFVLVLVLVLVQRAGCRRETVTARPSVDPDSSRVARTTSATRHEFSNTDEHEYEYEYEHDP